MNTPLRILVVDDDRFVTRTLSQILADGGHQVVGSCYDLTTAQQAVATTSPDLVLCDIFFDDEPQGIPFCRQLEAQHIPYYFITGRSHTEALALTIHNRPLGMIYKPLDSRDILTRLALRLGRPQEVPYLTIQHRGRNVRLPQTDVHYLESDGNYCLIHTASQRYAVLQAMRTLLEVFAPLGFLQIHRSYCVNPRQIVSYSATEIYLSSGHKLPIGRSYRQQFKHWVILD